MIVHVEYTGPLRSMVGQSREEIDLPDGATVTALIQAIGSLRDEKVRPHLLTPSGSVQPSLIVAVNGSACAALQTAQQVLKDRDTVVLLPPIAGG